ncbi:MAG: MliC family protein [Cardiobacteriaceae bacterium]|nr:MliC family protein [Cardiobacteriaceae bacterium]
MKSIALLLPACLALTACVGSGSGNEPVPQRQQGFNDAMKAGNQFSCQNGLAIAVNSLGTERVELHLDDQRAVLQIAVAASGERYTADKGLFGNATEWHQKGGEGMLEFVDPYGNRVETVCRSR